MTADAAAARAAPRRTLRHRLDAAALWALVLACGIGFLGAVMQRGLQARPDGAPPGTTLLQRLAPAITAAAPATRRALLEAALAQAPELQAIDWVGEDAVVRASTEPTAVGRPADEGLERPGARVALVQPGGRAEGWLVAHAAALAPPQAGAAALPLWTLALAVAAPLVALALVWTLPPQEVPRAAPAAARQRLHAARQRLARAAVELQWIEADAAAPPTGVFTRSGADAEPPR